MVYVLNLELVIVVIHFPQMCHHRNTYKNIKERIKSGNRKKNNVVIQD